MLDFSNTKVDIRRSVFSYAKIQKLVSAAIRNKKAFASIKPEGCYLDLGCGPNTNRDFCNLDYSWHPSVDICWDVTKGLPFNDKYVSGIFSEHMLEHLLFHDAFSLLEECRRILRPGGILRIVVPDGELYLRQYASHLVGQSCAMPYAEDIASQFGFGTPIMSINSVFIGHGHQFIWDYETLRAALLRCGFNNIERRSFGAGADPKLLRDTLSRKIESLYVEAN